jgi:hypothetical protein
MNFGSLIIADNGLIYPSTADAKKMLLGFQGDNFSPVNFNGKMYCYSGDGNYNGVKILNSYGLTLPQADPTIEQNASYITEAVTAEAVTANRTLNSYYYYYVELDGSSNTVDATLPLPENTHADARFKIKCINADNLCRLLGNGADIDGSPIVEFALNETLFLIFNGTDWVSESDPNITDTILAPFLNIPSWIPEVWFTSHLQGAGGIDLGGLMVKFNNLVYPGKPHPLYSTVYYSSDGEVFTDRAGVPALSETGFDDAVLWDWSTETVRFLHPRVCQTLFDSKGRPILTSAYFERAEGLDGVPLYQDYQPVSATEKLYCYIYGQQADFEQVDGNGTLVARVEVYEAGAWLNTGTDPIFNVAQWEFWNGYFWEAGLENAKEITEKFKHLWTSEVQYSFYNNKFIMMTTETSSLHFDVLWEPGVSTSKLKVWESNAPFGPWTFKKLLVDTDYDPDRRFVDDCSIFGITRNKLILAVTFWLPVDGVIYSGTPAGYGAYFGSVEIS